MQFENQLSIPDKIIAITNAIEEAPSIDVRNQLVAYINDLINNDFGALVQLLYRIDVNEQKLKELLKQNENTQAALIIAGLIISRQLQKIATKKQFDQRNKIDPDDSW